MLCEVKPPPHTKKSTLLCNFVAREASFEYAQIKLNKSNFFKFFWPLLNMSVFFVVQHLFAFVLES
jgi:hypothetical protein